MWLSIRRVKIPRRRETWSLSSSPFSAPLSAKTTQSMVLALKPHFSFLKLSVSLCLYSQDSHRWVCRKNYHFLSPFPWMLSYWLCLLIYTIPFKEQLGSGGGKEMWTVNAPSPNCRLVSSVLYIYDYEAICIKFTPFQILKIALLRKNRCTFSIPGWLITVLWRRHNIFIKLSVSRKMNTSCNNHTNVISERFHLQRVSASSWTSSGPSHIDQIISSGTGGKPHSECDGTLSTSPCHWLIVLLGLKYPSVPLVTWGSPQYIFEFHTRSGIVSILKNHWLGWLEL